MELLHSMMNRRSVRQYSGEPVSEEKVRRVLQAGLLAPSSRARRPWEFVVVRDRETLDRLSHCRVGSARMLAGASCAIAVVADEEKSDVWVEDCAVVMANMHLMADSEGLGSCWIQGRLREAEDGRTTEEFVREILGFPERYRLEALLSLGMPANHPSPHTLSELTEEKIHWDQF